LKVVHNHQPYSDCETVVASRQPSIHIYITNSFSSSSFEHERKYLNMSAMPY
jgi:hypothetical protein